jgi:hypothetical protein
VCVCVSVRESCLLFTFFICKHESVMDNTVRYLKFRTLSQATSRYLRSLDSLAKVVLSYVLGLDL